MQVVLHDEIAKRCHHKIKDLRGLKQASRTRNTTSKWQNEMIS
jgi:hypothetical protein